MYTSFATKQGVDIHWDIEQPGRSEHLGVEVQAYIMSLHVQSMDHYDTRALRVCTLGTLTTDAHNKKGPKTLSIAFFQLAGWARPPVCETAA